MHPIINKLQILEENQPPGAAIDLNHIILILGTLLSAKPENILELGIGTGKTSEILIQGIKYNKKGYLTCVDNLMDLDGNMSREIFESLKKRNISIVQSNERDFVYRTGDNQYQFLVSDADHLAANQWINEIFRIMSPNSFCFFHDIGPNYSNLLEYKIKSDELGKPNYLFNISSRPEENCERGLLMVINKK